MAHDRKTLAFQKALKAHESAEIAFATAEHAYTLADQALTRAKAKLQRAWEAYAPYATTFRDEDGLEVQVRSRELFTPLRKQP